LISCFLYGLLTNRISVGNNLARHAYAILIAIEVAALFAFGLDNVRVVSRRQQSLVSQGVPGWSKMSL